MPAEIQVIAFDFYGTLVDLTAITRACVEITPNADAFGATWRTKQLEYTFWLRLMNRYRDFDRVTEAALDFRSRASRSACQQPWGSSRSSGLL